MEAAVMQFIVGKLGNMISNEAQLLGGVKDQVEWVQTKLMEIRCYLRDANSNRNTSALAENWLNQLRDMSYRMEDAVDTFHLELEDECKKDPDLLDKIKSLFPNPTSVPGLHKLGKELEKIKCAFEEILKSKSDYGIDPLQDQGRGSGTVDLIKRREVYQDIVDETEVVGLNVAKKNILDLLLIHDETSTLPQKRKRDQETSKRVVITIVGPGGLGKTTLAHMVYRCAKAYFAFHMMLSVSQQFSQIDLLRKMLSKLDNSRLERCKDVTDLIENLKELLRRNRYLIILDDVWDTIVWEQLKDALPDDENGSRVLMTSRDEKVAKSTDYPKIYKPEFLDENKSLELLFKKARQYQKPSGILSLEEQTHSAWERVLRTMNWPEEGKACMNVLNMSYDYMSYEVKQCFLYLASFPEDHYIRANRLIKMWIAEGFIPQKENKTIEEKAEDYLELLYQSSAEEKETTKQKGPRCSLGDLLADEFFVDGLHEAQNVTLCKYEARHDEAKVQIIRDLEGAKERLELIKTNLTHEVRFDEAVDSAAVFHKASSVFTSNQQNIQDLLENSFYATIIKHQLHRLDMPNHTHCHTH
ncbi:Disease resistance protein RPP13 [Rhynchospora pubera]|uniref:Disease resistance protein RPP13 n=1 Tax=Rhynchospora pubera TaxID=906938 RepID=A0AAV8F5V4_9POAL|nr:Disease resistance protein RPP13 [Rhynchospora pubera]